MPIQVRLEDYTGNTRTVELSANASVDRLIGAIVTTLNLPVTDTEGRTINYHLNYRSQVLKEKETLKSLSVQQNDVIAIIPELTDIVNLAESKNKSGSSPDSMTDYF